MTLRDQLEAGFERWGHFVFGHARPTLAIALLVSLGFASQLPKLRIDGSAEAFLHETDPVRVTSDAYQAQFGRDNIILIAVQAPEIFDLHFLETLRALHEDLESQAPQIQDITSLVNARYTHGSEDELIVEDLLEEWPKNETDLAELQARVLSNPLYRNWLISADGRLTTVTIELDTYSSLDAGIDALSGFEDSEGFDGQNGGERSFLTGEEIFAIVETVQAVIAPYNSPDFKLHMTGAPVFTATLMTAMQRDILLFVSLSVAMNALLLFILFRRLSGVILPLVVVVLSVVCTVGTMAIMGITITLPIQVLPAFLLVVGVCASVHLLTHFLRAVESGSGREMAIAHSLRHSGLAILMTSLTTAGGLVSLASADLAPVMHFGIFGPLGVVFALLFTLTLLPALLTLIPLRRREQHNARPRMTLLDRFLLGCGATATRRPRAVLLATVGLLVIGLVGALRLKFSFHDMMWLPKATPVRMATEFVDRELQGSMTLEIQLESGAENGFHNPELLARLDELQRYTESLERGQLSIGKSVSLADILKEINQALNENRAEHYSIPRNERLIAQEFLLFENAGSDDLENFVDSQFSTAGVMLRIPLVDGIYLKPFIDEVEAEFQKVLGERIKVTMTGGAVVSARTFYAIIFSMAKSYTIAFLVVTPLMMLFLGSLRAGLISMLPNLTPLVLTLGLMGWLDFRLHFSTMMIGAMVLGIAVDDTIHFMHGFRRDYRRSGDPEAATRHTLETTGRAMLFTSIILCAGFLVYLFATMGNLRELGVFTGFAIATAFLADVLLAPALMVVFRRQLPAPECP